MKSGWVTALLQHSLNVAASNDYIHRNYGVVLTNQVRLEEDKRQFLEAVCIKLDFAEVHNTIGVVLVHQGKIDETFGYYRRGLEIKPEFVGVKHNLGIVLVREGKIEEGGACFSNVLKSAKNKAQSCTGTLRFGAHSITTGKTGAGHSSLLQCT